MNESLSLLGGLAQGKAQGVITNQNLQRQQNQQQMMADYYETQKEELKLKGKMEQLKLDQAMREQGMSDFLIQAIASKYGLQVPGGSNLTGPLPVIQQSSAGVPEHMAPEIQKVADYTGIPLPNLIAQIKTESGFDPKAVGKAGEQGLMQILPATQQLIGVTDPFDWKQNLWGGAKYLADQYGRFGNWRDAFAAYNTGPETVANKGITPAGEKYLQAVGITKAPAARQTSDGAGVDIMRDPLVVALFNKQMGGKFNYNPEPYKDSDVRLPNGMPGKAPFDPTTGVADMSKARSEAFKMDSVDIETKEGEVWTYNKNPYTGELDMATPPVRKKPAQGKSSAEAGKIQLAQTGLDAFDEAMGIIFTPDGQIDWTSLANSAAGTPKTKGRNLRGLMKNSIDGIVRAATGAALNPSELDYYVEVYVPSPLDDQKTVTSKLTRLEGFLNGYLEKMDPTGSMRVRTGPVPQAKGKGKPNNAQDEAEEWLKGQK